MLNQGFLFAILSKCDYHYEKETSNDVSHDAEALFPVVYTTKNWMVAVGFFCQCWTSSGTQVRRTDDEAETYHYCKDL